MKKNLAIGLLAALPLTLVAQDAKKPEAKAEAKTEAKGDAKAAAPSEKEMMEAWMKVASPSDAHKKLEPFAGTFTTKVKSWMQPGAPPMESDGTIDSKWVLGGRFLEQRYEGKFMDQPFSGIGYFGYDNYKKKYNGSWIDNMGTMMMSMLGTVDASGKKFTMTGRMDDVMTKKNVAIKEVITVHDNDSHDFEMWATGPDGKMFKTMEIKYTRKK